MAQTSKEWVLEWIYLKITNDSNSLTLYQQEVGFYKALSPRKQEIDK